ncbi:MAG: hypothetical protein J1F69_00185 [Clostridiales bacterium]|nr:hypothetical protein [Clostridiales bacterium]
MTNNSYDKIKYNILRAALILIGAGTGYLALWQYFSVYPNIIRREYQIVITVVSSALTALIFGLSTKAVYRLVESIVSAVTGIKERMGVRGIVAVLLGLLSAVVLVVVFDIVIRRFIDIWAVRLLADVLVYILSAAGFCVGFTKWLNAPKTEKADAPAVGYLLAAECFKDERVLTAVHTLINVKVLGGAYKALCLYGGESGGEAAKLMDALINGGMISVLNTGKDFKDGEEYEQLEQRTAKAKRLKRISLEPSQNELSVSAFSLPTAEMKQAALALQTGEPSTQSENEKSSSSGAPAEDVNGQIIIDK